MKKLILLFLFPLFLFSASMNKYGIVTKISKYSVEKVIDIISHESKKVGLGDFTVIDHQKNILENSNTPIKHAKLIVFNKPTICTDLLKYDPAVGLDLPLRIIVYEDDGGGIFIKYRDPKFLKNIYNLGDKREALIMSKMMDDLTETVSKDF